MKIKDKIKTVEEFVERIKNKQSVSRFDIELGFKWTIENSKILSYADLRSADLRYADLRYADLSYVDLRSTDLSYADLSYADLRSADLSYADLSYAEGEFYFNYGVKLKVVKNNELNE
jgi:uncharacterized protein YjbI with pentapeptide repeats